MRRPFCGRMLLYTAFGIIINLAAGITSAATRRVPLDTVDIQTGIDLSQPGDTLLIAPNTYFTYGLKMKSGITLLGDGSAQQIVIDAQQQGMVIDLSRTGSATRIANITFTGGKTSGLNIGEIRYPIACIESEINIENCIFRNNSSLSDGAGFYCDSSSPILVNCEFIDNTSISGSGGGFCSRQSNPILVNCVFRGNTAAAYGGGIYLTGFGSTPLIQKCIIIGNSANFGGGIAGAALPVVLAGSTIRENTATDSGGGVHLLSRSSLEAHTSTFFANIAPSGKTLWALSNSLVDFYCSDIDYLGIAGGCVPIFHYQGCQSTPTTTLSWGEIKTIYK